MPSAHPEEKHAKEAQDPKRRHRAGRVGNRGKERSHRTRHDGGVQQSPRIAKVGAPIRRNGEMDEVFEGEERDDRPLERVERAFEGGRQREEERREPRPQRGKGEEAHQGFAQQGGKSAKHAPMLGAAPRGSKAALRAAGWHR